MKRTILLLTIIAAICIIGCKKEAPTNNVFTNDKHHTDTTTIPPVDTTHVPPPVDTIPVGDICDTSNLTYTNSIQAIISYNCTGCHSPNGTGGGDDDDDDDDHGGTGTGNTGEEPYMDTYAGLVDAIQDEGSSKFIRMINHQTKPMPPDYTMTECERRKIALWIARGMPQ